MKIIVKTNLDPELKEVFEGKDLTVTRNRHLHKSNEYLRVSEGENILGEFDSFLYWRKMDTPLDERLRSLEATMGKIRAIMDNDLLMVGERLDAITALMDKENQLELIREPDKDLLLLNLGYLDGFVMELPAGLPEETLRWCFYTVQRYIGHDELPGGPADPNSADWTWEKFKTSFTKMTVSG